MRQLYVWKNGLHIADHALRPSLGGASYKEVINIIKEVYSYSTSKMSTAKENRDPRRNAKLGVVVGLNDKIVLLKFDQSGRSNLRSFREQSLMHCTATLGLLPMEKEPAIPERDTEIQ